VVDTRRRREIPHDQLEAFSPPEIRDAVVARARRLPGVFTSPSPTAS
jgi:hypothetical protein